MKTRQPKQPRKQPSVWPLVVEFSRCATVRTQLFIKNNQNNQKIAIKIIEYIMHVYTYRLTYIEKLLLGCRAILVVFWLNLLSPIKISRNQEHFFGCLLGCFILQVVNYQVFNRDHCLVVIWLLL